MAAAAIQAIKQFFTRNLALKLLCLATAFSIWSLSSISRKTSAELAIPLRLCKIPAGFTPGTPLPATIGYTLSGTAAQIGAVRRSNAAVSLSLEGAASPGKTLFMNLESHLRLPEGVKVTRVSPAALEINLEPARSPQGDQHQ